MIFRTPLVAAGFLMIAQPTFDRRMEGLRKTTSHLSYDSFVDQAVPVFVVTFIVGMLAVCGAYAVRRLRASAEYRRHCLKLGLSDEETTRLEQLAVSVGLRPKTRILRSVTCFERITTAFLDRRMQQSDLWPIEVEALRSIGHKLGFAPTEAPQGLESTRHIGAPWPVKVRKPGTDASAFGFISTDVSEYLVVHLLDEARDFLNLIPKKTVMLRPLSAGDDARQFPCPVERTSRNGPIVVLRLEHGVSDSPEEARQNEPGQGAGAPEKTE